MASRPRLTSLPITPHHRRQRLGTTLSVRSAGGVIVRAVTRTNRAALNALIAEATVDCYNDSECVTGFYTMLEEHLALPFHTNVLGVEVTAQRVDLSGDDQIVVVCVRGRDRQRIPILDLPLPTPAPRGVEWIEAYRQWFRP
jgi:hypothetical protein